ncbi:MAG: hypothetical protein RIR39_539 [Pseudomonadota bacterium]
MLDEIEQDIAEYKVIWSWIFCKYPRYDVDG